MGGTSLVKDFETAMDETSTFTKLLYFSEELKSIDDESVIAFRVSFFKAIETAKRESLTRKQIEVLDLIMKGYSQREMGKILNISQQAVHQHIKPLRQAIADIYFRNDVKQRIYNV